MSLIISIIGRPNVGKSTLFNRLTGTKHAIVHDLPGVTRDIREGVGSIGPLKFKIIDTPGLEEAASGSLANRMTQQSAKAVEQSDVVLMVVDGRAGLLPDDKFFASWLRRQNKPVILVINKCESKYAISNVKEFYVLGFENLSAISAEHGEGLGDLYDLLAPHQRDLDKEGPEDKISLAIVGRPNAGKSTLINKLLRQERVLTGPEAGITRDSIAIDWEYKGTNFKLIDTAGIRKKAKIHSQIEKLSLEDSFRAIQYANVVILLIDGNAGLESQDISIASRVIEEGRALIIAVNKCDIIPNKDEYILEMVYKIESSLSQARTIPICYVSAMKSTGIPKLMDNVLETYKLWNSRISTSKINDWLAYALAKHQVPLSKLGRRIKIKYATQVKSRPPTFVLFTNYPKDIPDSYTKYLIGSLREHLNLPATPIRILYKKSDNPYSESKSDKSS